MFVKHDILQIQLVNQCHMQLHIGHYFIIQQTAEYSMFE